MSYTTLISVVDLAKHLDDPAFVIFDCRHELTNPEFGVKAYAQSHIPNALFAHLDRDLAAPLTGRNGRHPLPDPGMFAGWLARMGVSNDKQVIGYDNAGGVYGSRLWWMLRWVGASRRGGARWRLAGMARRRAIGDHRRARPDARPDSPVSPENPPVDAKYVLDHLQSPDMVLIDARANDRFHGQNETIDPIGGHIPGARNRFFKDNLTPQGFFKSPEQLRDEFKPFVGSGSPDKIVSQCGSGVTACHNLLAMEIAGLKGGRLYPGSWSEWIADPSRPRAT